MVPLIQRAIGVLSLVVGLCSTSAASQNLPVVDRPTQLSTSDPSELYSSAAKALNAGRVVDARTIAGDILDRFPDYFRAYPLFWNIIGRTQTAELKRATVEQHLALLVLVPIDRRTEDYYSAVISGYQLINEISRQKGVREEAVSRFPRGSLAQEVRLDAARSEADPQKQVALLKSYIADFADNVSWTELASREVFDAVFGHRQKFNAAMQREAVEDLERLTRRYVDKFGDPFRYVSAIRKIANALCETQPDIALLYADKGIAFIDERWTATDAFDQRSRILLLPSMLRAYIQRREWPAARRVGSALVQEIDGGALSSATTKELDEQRVRCDLALALEQDGKIALAREQLAWAAVSANTARESLESFTSRHPLSEDEQEAFQATLAAKMAVARSVREAQLRREVLAAQTHERAQDFTLRDLSGKAVTLSALRSKVVVLDFWATWCGPCIAELEELKRAYARYRGDPEVVFLAVSTDTDKQLVAPHVERRGYVFPVLLTDGSIEASYKTQSIPRLYIVDRRGVIRFAEVGFSDDGYYQEKLDWMIEATKKFR